MNQTLGKSIVTLLLIFALIVIGDAFYSAVVIGNQLAYASILSTGITVLWYLIPAGAAIYGIVILWKKKTK
jgi:hypothetical protein